MPASMRSFSHRSTWGILELVISTALVITPYWNGVPQATVTVGAGLDKSTRFNVGRDNTTAGNSINGHNIAYLAYEGNINAASRLYPRRYLASKYGITLP